MPAAPQPTDAELIALVRAGDRMAYGALYERHHDATVRVARRYVEDLADAEDLVAEAFTRVLTAIARGCGPDEAFGPYLHTTLRHIALGWRQSKRRVRPVEDVSWLEPAAIVPAADQGRDLEEAAFDRELAARAFASLPQRWQKVLWHLEVEGQSPRQIAPLLDLSANAVSALAVRAREGLRQAYLQAHAGENVESACQPHVGRLAAFVRGTLGVRGSEALRRHLDDCPSCSRLHRELIRLNGPLRGFLIPLALGSAAVAKAIAKAGGATPAPAGVHSGTMIRTWMKFRHAVRIRHLSGMTRTTAMGGAAATCAPLGFALALSTPTPPMAAPTQHPPITAAGIPTTSTSQADDDMSASALSTEAADGSASRPVPPPVYVAGPTGPQTIQTSTTPPNGTGVTSRAVPPARQNTKLAQLALAGSTMHPSIDAADVVPTVPAVPTLNAPSPAVPDAALPKLATPTAAISTPAKPTLATPTPAMPTPALPTPTVPTSPPPAPGLPSTIATPTANPHA